MTPLYGFGDKAGQPKDYKCDCSFCGGDQTDWEALSNTQKNGQSINTNSTIQGS